MIPSLPRHLMWAYERGEIRWSMVEYLQDKLATGGPEEAEEIETSAMRRQGWPIANVPGERILPGRDGWVAWNRLGG